MAIITLTTDWGVRDHFTGALKGLLYSAVNSATVVDITHQISPHNIQQAAYVFRNCFAKFPVDTIHFLGVHNAVNTPDELLAIQYQGHFFICMNNGLFSMVTDGPPDDVVIIEHADTRHPGFDLETIAVASSHISAGLPLRELGRPPSKLISKTWFEPVLEEDVIRGLVVYIDDFGNIVTNIRKQLFEEQRRERRFEIVTKNNDGYSISQLSAQYYEQEAGDLVALFNSAGYLEIAINQQNASRLLNIKLNDNIRVEFK